MSAHPIAAPLRDGLRKALRQYWKILKIVLPVFLLVTALRLVPIDGTPLLPRLALWARPAMGWLGLPGEAALAIVLGWALNIYACVSAMAAGGYSPAQATAMGLIVGIAIIFSSRRRCFTSSRRRDCACWSAAAFSSPMGPS